jgi:glycosyltransferase involved in cell wall biosynthesis
VEHTQLQTRPASQRPSLSSERDRSARPADQLTVALIPAYNESRFIGSIVISARRYVDVVVVVDDGSRDGTAEIAHQAGAVVICQPQNGGKAAAINSGLRYLRDVAPTAVVMLDGDGQHCADDIPAVLAPVLAGAADIVVGSRFLDIVSDIPAYRQVGQHGLTLATNLASGVRVSDSQSGFRALSTRAVELLCFTQSGFSIESEMQFQAREHGLRVAEAPIKVIYAERAKRNPWRHGMQVLNGIMQLVGQTRPLLFFSLAGVSIGLLGALFGLHVVDIYSRTATLAVGYALITVLLCVIGSVLFFAGVILNATRAMIVELHTSIASRLASIRDESGCGSPQEQWPTVLSTLHGADFSRATISVSQGESIS